MRDDRRQIVQELKRNGTAMRDISVSQPKMTFYKPDGEAMLLPADPRSLKSYLARGFTLTPPKEEPHG